MRVWIKIGAVVAGAAGYETWDYSRMNPFHQRTYVEEMILRGAAPQADTLTNILRFNCGKEYTRSVEESTATRTITYSPTSGIILVIEEAGKEPVTYVDTDADGFAEKHGIGVQKKNNLFSLHYCAPNTAPDIMF